MSKQTFGIGGPWTGQIGKTYVGLKVVNGHAIRKYVVPANPRTAPQVTQRGKFGLAGRLAALLKDTIVKDLWNAFAVLMYGVNYFTSVNTKALTSDTDFPSVVTSKGGWESIAAYDGVTYDTANGQLIVNWIITTSSVGTATDKVYLVIIDANDYDPPSDIFNLVVYVVSNKTRADGAAGYVVQVGTGKNNTKFHAYITARNPVTETKLKVSSSKYSVVSAA